MRSFFNYPRQQRGVSCVNNVSVFAEDSNRLWWFLCQWSVFPVWTTNRKTPVGRRSLRSNKGEQNECDWIHFELQSAFAELLGDLYFSLSSVISFFWPLWATCYLGNTKLQFGATSYSQRLLRKPLCMTWKNSQLREKHHSMHLNIKD